ncbi:MAG: outer membrane lipoprotein carrier protein LolA [Bacilli bacterium]|nr:outer membrane lipoprotein carrier protein LolA [Bacilli bacterium]
MKKMFLVGMCILSIFLFCGCGKKTEKDILKELTKKIENSKGYHIVGELEIINSEYVYDYDVDVAYKDGDFFRVSLKNKTNNHEQIILKNKEGVYVLTPSLNKSFKFQSDWPYNNSQSYLFQTLLKDIKNDEEKLFESNDNEYIYITSVNYSNNKDLKKQKIYIDKDVNITRVEVLTESDEVKMKMNFNNVDMDAKFDDDYFELKQNMTVSTAETEETKTTSKIQDIIYPMYIPENTYLTGQNVVNKDDGERVILTFSGEKPFIFVQETISYENEISTIPVYGEPLILTDTIGALSDNSASWVSNNIEYYIVSDSLSQEELVSVVQSVSVMPVSK